MYPCFDLFVVVRITLNHNEVSIGLVDVLAQLHPGRVDVFAPQVGYMCSHNCTLV